jgi:hypothetical protein
MGRMAPMDLNPRCHLFHPCRQYRLFRQYLRWGRWGRLVRLVFLKLPKLLMARLAPVFQMDH